MTKIKLMIRAPDEPDVIDEVYEAAQRGESKERLREMFGGRRVYIPVHPRLRPEQHQQIIEALRANQRPVEVAKAHKVSVRHVYHLRKLAGM